MATFTLFIGNRNYSSWSLRAWLALKATDADFNEVLVPLGQPETGPTILKSSPSGLVPALRVGDLVIWDSLAIGEYLAESYPEAGLWPVGANERAVARSVVSEMHSGVTAVRGNMPMNIRASYPGAGRGTGVGGDIARIIAIWESCRRDFGVGGDFLFGGFTIADAFFSPIVSRFRTYGVELGAIAGAYAQAVWAWPAMREWVEKATAEEWVVDRYDR